MYVTEFTLKNFRNIPSLSIQPGRGVNIIYGMNAQGKTNLIEALWLLTGQKSFRRARERELLRFEQASATVDARFFAQKREQQCVLTLGERKSCYLNGVELESASGLQGEFFAVVFSPEHLTLVKEGPSIRRRFLDDAISQIMPRYSSLLGNLNRILTQRSALLADMQRNSGLEFMLDMWDEQLAKVGASIIRARLRYCQLLEEKAGKIYEGLSSGAEQLTMRYAATTPGVSGSEGDYSIILEALRQTRREDVRSAANTVGPHRDDLELLVGELPARLYGSQGQQRSCALALKLAECEIIKDTAGTTPVVILDDVLSELDKSRRCYLLGGMEERQVFITCCDPGYFAGITDAKVFHMQAGEVTEQPLAITGREEISCTYI